MDKYKKAYKVNTIYTTEEIKELKEVITALEKEGCSCDLLYGYRCGIHSLTDKVRKIINK